jgi:octopine/nopaline transport system substrate-binding protein
MAERAFEFLKSWRRLSMKLHAVLVSSALALAALASPAAAKDWKTVTITLEGAYAPWNMTNADGSLGGFEPELAKVLCERAKVECKLVASDWDGMIPALNAGKFDMIMDALSITDERKKVIDFTIPYAATPAGFATTKDSPLANAPGTGTEIRMDVGQTGVKEVEAMKEAFKGKTIGIQAATVYAKFIYDNFGKDSTIREYKTGADRDLDLQNGRIDLGFDDTVYFANASRRRKANSSIPARTSSARSGARARGSACANPIPTCATCSAPRSSPRWRMERSRNSPRSGSRPTFLRADDARLRAAALNG